MATCYLCSFSFVTFSSFCNRYFTARLQLVIFPTSHIKDRCDTSVKTIDNFMTVLTFQTQLTTIQSPLNNSHLTNTATSQLRSF